MPKNLKGSFQAILKLVYVSIWLQSLTKYKVLTFILVLFIDKYKVNVLNRHKSQQLTNS